MLYLHFHSQLREIILLLSCVIRKEFHVNIQTICHATHLNLTQELDFI